MDHLPPAAWFWVPAVLLAGVALWLTWRHRDRPSMLVTAAIMLFAAELVAIHLYLTDFLRGGATGSTGETMLRVVNVGYIFLPVLLALYVPRRWGALPDDGLVFAGVVVLAILLFALARPASDGPWVLGTIVLRRLAFQLAGLILLLRARRDQADVRGLLLVSAACFFVQVPETVGTGVLDYERWRSLREIQAASGIIPYLGASLWSGLLVVVAAVTAGGLALASDRRRVPMRDAAGYAGALAFFIVLGLLYETFPPSLDRVPLLLFVGLGFAALAGWGVMRLAARPPVPAPGAPAAPVEPLAGPGAEGGANGLHHRLGLDEDPPS